MFESFRDIAGKSVLDCLQAFHLRRVDPVEKGTAVNGQHCRQLKRNCFKCLSYSQKEDVHVYLDLDLDIFKV